MKGKYPQITSQSGCSQCLTVWANMVQKGAFDPMCVSRNPLHSQSETLVFVLAV